MSNDPDINLLQTLKQLDAQRIDVANEILGADGLPGLVALPDDFTLHDLEARMPTRRRLRGKFVTASIDDFVKYVRNRNTDAGDPPEIFVSNKALSAVAVLNMGTHDLPGHADDRASLVLEPTAEARALDGIHASTYTQAEFIELLGDWQHAITFRRDGNSIPMPQALAALRNLTITRAKTNQHVEQVTRREAGALERIEVQDTDNLPDGFLFQYVPAIGLNMVDALVRLTLLPTEDDNPKRAFIRTRVVAREAMGEMIQKAFVAELQERFGDAWILTGSYEG